MLTTFLSSCLVFSYPRPKSEEGAMANNSDRKGVSRRDFLKGMAAAPSAPQSYRAGCWMRVLRMPIRPNQLPARLAVPP